MPLSITRALLLAVMAFGTMALEAVVASPEAAAETRTLRMYFTHTKESATITYKKNGRYVKSGLKQVNRFLRDWRRKEPTNMDPELLDLVWEVYKASGSRKPIHVISGYRSPSTNNALRKRGRNVAKSSQHTLGKALDFFMPDVSVDKLRALGLKAHRGGVGYYRGSFVHLDTGRVRHWPRMSARELAKVFPRGDTIHVPSNGRKMKRYDTALANLKNGRNADGSKRGTTVRRSLLARLFSRSGTDDTEGEEAEEAAPVQKKAEPAPKPAPVVVAKASPLPKARSGPNLFAQEAAAAAKAAELEAERARLAAEAAKKDTADQARVAELTAAAEKAADAARAARAAEEAQRVTQVAAVIPERLTVPSRRPPASRPTLQPTVVVESITQPANDVAGLASDVTTALAPTEVAASPTDLALAVPAAPVPPALPVLRPPADIPAVASGTAAAVPVPASPVAPEAASIEVAKLEPAATPDLANLRSDVTSTLARPTPAAPLPSITPTTRPSDVAKASVPVPAVAARDAAVAKLEPAVTQPAVKPSLPAAPARIARTDDTTLVPVPGTSGMRAALSIGDLDTRAIKAWAVATNTRSGPSAKLRAPNYRRGLIDGAPSRVYRAGFGSSIAPLRADGFRGADDTRVAFADLSGN